MDDAMFRRMGRENYHLAVTVAHSVALKIDAKYGTFFARMNEAEQLKLLRLRAVALKHFSTVAKVVEIIRVKYGQHNAATGLGLRLASLVSDKALAHASKELAAAPVRHSLRPATAWTAKGLASLTDQQLRGDLPQPNPGGPSAYPYRGRPNGR